MGCERKRTTTMADIRELRSDSEIIAAFPLMSELRDRIQADTFLAEVRRQQAQGYELIGAFEGGRLVALAGVRRTHTLSRGEHLFVDDLITDARVRGAGHGSAMMRWLAARAAAEGLLRIDLDSRITARGFYERLGFTFHMSMPCWLEIPKYLAEAGTVL
jgi:GNAT superfamily N-acetyltransferase